MRVLIVEDSATVRLTLERAVRGLGLTPSVFDQAEAALTAHLAAPFPILLLDWMLPGMTGLELCRRVRDAPGGAQAVIVIVTSRDGQEDLSAALEAGADDFLAKPIEVSLLCTRLQIATRNARERQRRRATEIQLRARDQQLRQLQRLESLGRLAGGVAHDFNNVLTIIQGHTELVQEDLPADSPLQFSLAAVQEAAARAASLTRQLLAFSRRRHGDPELLDVNEVVTRLERMLHRLLGAKVEVALDCAASPGTTWADRAHVEQIIVNLALNARDAMPEGGEITLRTRALSIEAGEHAALAAGDYVAIEVDDTGPGLDEEARARVFEPFYANPHDHDPTPGLGLSVAFGIAAQYGGLIEASALPEQGNRLRAVLPLVTVRPATPPPVLAPGAGARPADRAEVILLAEDDFSIRQMTARLLRDDGYDVVDADDGASALERFADRAGRVDLVLADVVMRRVDGPSLIEALDAQGYRGPVLFISGFSKLRALEAVNQRPLADFLDKPFSPRVLLERVRDLLDRAHSSG